MKKTILITGSTDGIGFETAKMFVSKGHRVLLHGRSSEKLDRVERMLSALADCGQLEVYVADLSDMGDVKALANAVARKHDHLDVLINNAGVFCVSNPKTKDGLDVRFAVNTIAPFLLTKLLLPLFGREGRVVNLSSAAQSPVDLKALAGQANLYDGAAYAQSKLAITMWSNYMAMDLKDRGPAIIAVNPGSMLASKMVKQAYGVAGADLQIGADILTYASLSDEFANASGKYYDNDSGQFASPHPHALKQDKVKEVVAAIESVLAKLAS